MEIHLTRRPKLFKQTEPPLADLALVGTAVREGLLIQAHPVQLDAGMGYSLIAPRTSSSLGVFAHLRQWLKRQAEMTRRELSIMPSH